MYLCLSTKVLQHVLSTRQTGDKERQSIYVAYSFECKLQILDITNVNDKSRPLDGFRDDHNCLAEGLVCVSVWPIQGYQDIPVNYIL